MIIVPPVTLEGHSVRLEPLRRAHESDLAAATADGKLWDLSYASAPAPHDVRAYIDAAIAAHTAGHSLAWAVRDLASGDVIGCTRYHDIVGAIGRVEIGGTWYAARFQRTHVNTACKVLLLTHAFESLQCAVVALRTDRVNFRSQRAIESLGAKRDGVLRHHQLRRDGIVRDTVMYSILAAEWRDVKAHLHRRLARLTSAAVR